MHTYRDPTDYDFYISIGKMISDTNQHAVKNRDIITGIVTPIDLLNYITDTENRERRMASQNDVVHSLELE